MENKQFIHVQIPHDMTEKGKLKPYDLLVYANIRRHCNKNTKIGWPSYRKLSELCGLCVNSIIRSINNLAETGYIEVYKRQGRQYYKILKDMPFEVFSLEFLDNDNLTPLEKSYILASQQYFLKDSENKTGIVKYSNRILSGKINMSAATITKCNKSLVKKGYLDLIETGMDSIGKQSKIFRLSEFGQAIVFELAKHEERINENAEEIREIKQNLKHIEDDSYNAFLKNMQQFMKQSNGENPFANKMSSEINKQLLSENRRIKRKNKELNSEIEKLRKNQEFQYLEYETLDVSNEPEPLIMS